MNSVGTKYIYPPPGPEFCHLTVSGIEGKLNKGLDEMAVKKYPEHLFVRVHPYNPGLGYVTRRLHYKNILYREDRGWKKVPRALGEELRKVFTYSNDPNSVPVFGVYEYEEARDIEFQENYEADPRRRIEDAAREGLEDAPVVETVSEVSEPEPKKDPELKEKSKTKKKKKVAKKKKKTTKTSRKSTSEK